MKTKLAMLLVVVLGIGLGVGIANIRISSSPWQPDSVSSDRNSATPITEVKAVPKLVIDSLHYDFGVLDIAESDSHDFVVFNHGNAPLKLTAGATTCRCTVSKLKEEEVAPGGSTKVTLEFKPSGNLGPYHQSAEILSNDPERPRVTLSIAGKITAATQLIPSQLVFSQISSGDSSIGRSQLLHYTEGSLKVLNHEWSNSATAPFFDVKIEPLAPQALAEHSPARDGLLIAVIVKPGLPQGRFQQKLVLHTDVASSPTLTLPIEGTITSEIAVVGRGWDADTGILTLGTVPRAAGAQCRLMLIVRGASRDKVEFVVDRVVPPILRVTLGEKREMNHGAVRQTPLLLEIPPDSPPVNHLGSEQNKLGEILLDTNHPQVPKLRILVRFAVEG